LERTQKDRIVADLAERLAGAKTVIVTDFKGLNVGRMGLLRRQVAAAGGEYQVVKNTLLRLAAQNTSAAKLNDLLSGNNALGTTSGDPVSLAKALIDFAKDNQTLVIKGGVVSGKVVDVAQIGRLATLPSREVLLAQLLGTMNSVPTTFVRVLNAVISQLVYALAAVRDQKEQTEAA
jgi:large subunit ribosomal protein L10